MSNMNIDEELTSMYPNCMANVYCGCFCPDGWVEIVKEALTVLEAAGAKVAQIKSKFGGLRLYWDPPEHWRQDWHIYMWPWIACHMAINIAENRSVKTCSQCGSIYGSRQKINGCWVSVCDRHAQ